MRKEILLRLDAEIVDRLDVLIELEAANPEFSGHKVNKSDVQRKALLAGIAVLEQHYGIASKRK